MKKILLVLFVCSIVTAQQVTTVSGFAGAGYVDGSLANAKFSGPDGICADPTGTLYIADGNNYCVRKIDFSTGVVSTFAGTAVQGFADGSLATAQFHSLFGVCMDSAGNLFVTDSGNNKIRKIDVSTGMVSTFAGSTQGFANGTGTSAKFSNPTGICIDSNDNLYVVEFGSNLVRKITPTRQVTTFAGSTYGFADGVGSAAKFATPMALCADAQNTIFVADTYNAKIRKIEPNGTVSTIAGSTYGYLDGIALTSQFSTTNGICIDSNNNLYVTDNDRIRKIDLTNNVVSTYVGSLTGAYATVDGEGNLALLSDPKGIGITANDIIYFCQFGPCKIRKITSILSTDNFVENSLQLYPNPNTGSFSINTVQNCSIVIYDLLGQLVFTKKNLQSENTLLETGLKKGGYLVCITSAEGKTTTQKMVIE